MNQYEKAYRAYLKAQLDNLIFKYGQDKEFIRKEIKLINRVLEETDFNDPKTQLKIENLIHDYNERNLRFYEHLSDSK